MLSNAHEKQTEQLAKKHGRATNQKSSFTNLLKTKIVRPQRQVDDKENQKLLMSAQPKGTLSLNQSKVLKIKDKNSTTVPISQKNEKLEQILSYKRKNQLQCHINESSIQDLGLCSQNKINTMSDSQDITPISLVLQSIRLNTFEEQAVVQTSCMTDECYYQKQLQIKVQILKKERDQLWDSINGIVKQNNLLKETLQLIALKKQTALSQSIQTEITQLFSQGFQTDTIQCISSGLQTDTNECQSISLQTDPVEIENQIAIIQTEITNDQLQLLELRYQKAIKERHEVLEFCETLYLQDISEELSECLNMKDAITEYLSIKIDGLLKQFDSEKAMLNKMYEEYINKFKRNEEEITERNQNLLIELQQIKAINKKLTQNVHVLEARIEQLEASSCILNNELIEAQEENAQCKKQAELIKEGLQTEKKEWEEKKKTYTILLASSHKTINNLMAQMKQFQELASSSHYKHLKANKNININDI